MLWQSGKSEDYVCEARNPALFSHREEEATRKDSSQHAILLHAYLSISALILRWINRLKKKTRSLQEF
jgi:hypothetical protein